MKLNKMLLIQLLCGCVALSASTSHLRAEPAPLAAKDEKSDQVKTVGKVKVTLVETTQENDLFIATFIIENGGDKALNVSAPLCFEAKNNDGEKLDIDYFAAKGLNGTVDAGDKLKGAIAWKTNGAAAPIKISYQPDLLSSAKAIWLVK